MSFVSSAAAGDYCIKFGLSISGATWLRGFVFDKLFGKPLLVFWS